MKRRAYLPAIAAGIVMVVLASVGAVAVASPPSGVTPLSAATAALAHSLSQGAW